MKTIQETLRELDAKEVIDCYIMKHPGNIYRENKRRPKGMTIEEYKEKKRSKVQSLIDRLLSLTPNASDDGRDILFAYKSIKEDPFSYVDIGLINEKELLEAEDVSKVRTYDYIYEKQVDALGYYVADTPLTQNNLVELVVSFMDEVSYFGYEQEYLEEEIKYLEEAKNKDDSNRRCFNSMEEMYKELGDVPDEIYPEEEEKLEAYQNAIVDYNNYCREMELERVKESIAGIRSENTNTIGFDNDIETCDENRLIFSWPIDLPELWIYQNLKTKKYSFDVETVYEFGNTRAAIINTKRILEAFAQWMVENNHDVSFRLEYRNVFNDGISLKRQYDTIEEAYAAFRILALGFISNAKDVADEEDRNKKQVGDISFRYDPFYREWVATCKSPFEFTIVDGDIVKLAEKVRKVIPEMEEIERVTNDSVISEEPNGSNIS